MEVRYRAVGHGTRSGRLTDAVDYYKQAVIFRDESIKWIMSGTNAQDLVAIRGFFAVRGIVLLELLIIKILVYSWI